MIGGLFASWVMSEFQAGMARAASKLKQQRADGGWSVELARREAEQSSESSEPATVKVAVAIAENVFHQELPDDYKQRAGDLVHYVFGVATGGLYGLAAELSPAVETASGALFGAALWLVSDETMVPLLGFSKGPREYPVSAHVSALAAHLVYAIATETTRRFLRQGYLAR